MAGSKDDLKVVPVVSIIVPCYNQAAYLPDALNSVIAQTASNWECVIVDDGSSDNTAEVASVFCKQDNRIKYIFQQNSGLASARNTGITHSSGQFILPLDADDKFGVMYVERALNVFQGRENVTLVYSEAMYFGAKNERMPLRPYSYINLLKENMIFCSAVFRREDFNAAGEYDENLRTGYEDWDLYIRLLNNESCVVQLNDVHFFYRIKEKSMLTGIDETKQKQLNSYLYHKYHEIYERYFDDPIKLIRKTELYENLYKNSPDYRLGNLVLGPFRELLNIVRKRK